MADGWGIEPSLASLVLETTRLFVRPFSTDDLDRVYQILDVELQEAEFSTVGSEVRDQRARWLEWTIMGYEQYDRLHQPPYGERAVVLRPAGQLIGACGFVPSWSQIAGMRENPPTREQPVGGPRGSR